MGAGAAAAGTIGAMEVGGAMGTAALAEGTALGVGAGLTAADVGGGMLAADTLGTIAGGVGTDAIVSGVGTDALGSGLIDISGNAGWASGFGDGATAFDAAGNAIPNLSIGTDTMGTIAGDSSWLPSMSDVKDAAGLAKSAAGLAALGYAGYNAFTGQPAITVGSTPQIGALGSPTDYQTTPTGGRDLSTIVGSIGDSTTSLKSGAAGLNDLSQALRASALDGPLPAGYQGGLNASADASKAALSGTYARLGLGNSTMAAQGAGNIEAQKAAAADTYRTQMLSEALTAANMSTSEYQAAVTSDQQSAAIQQAVEQLAVQQATADLQAREQQAKLQADMQMKQADIDAKLQTAQTQQVQQVASSGGGSVICTQLHASGLVGGRELAAMRKWGDGFTDARFWRGYWTWAFPYTGLMRRSPTAAAVAHHVFSHVARQSAAGRVYGAVLSGFSWCIGAVVSGREVVHYGR